MIWAYAAYVAVALVATLIILDWCYRAAWAVPSWALQLIAAILGIFWVLTLPACLLFWGAAKLKARRRRG